MLFKSNAIATADQVEYTPSARVKSLADFVLFAAWIGLVTGLSEVCILFIKQTLLRQWIHLGREFVWMTPLADLILFTTTGFFLFIVARRWPRLVTLRIVAFVLTFLSLFSLLFMFHPQLYKYAAMLLAAGLAMQSSRCVAAHRQRFLVVVRRSFAWVLILIIGFAVAVHGRQLLVEYRTIANLPPPSANASNVLLIVLDTVRARNLSVYGYVRPTTPQLERFGQSGVLFERAISTAPWTLTSHASMFTGRFPYELSADWLTALDATYPTLAEVFSEHGYLTGGFVANAGYVSYEHGLDRGFSHYEDYPISPGQIVVSCSLGRYITDSRRLRRLIGYQQILGRKTASQVNSAFLDWLSRRPGRPFFAFLNYFDAHIPYLPPSPFDRKFGIHNANEINYAHGHIEPGESNPGAHKDTVSPQQIQAMIDGYDESIAYIDYHLGLLFKEMERRGLLKNTLIIITSDHGEEFGEHNIFDHGNSLYLRSVHVPLLMSFPSRIPAGKRFSEPVSLRELPATVIDLLRLEGRTNFPGSSLARYWQQSRGPGSSSEVILSEVSRAKNVPPSLPVSRGDMQAVIKNGFRYIKNADGEEELYDFENDPLEKHNLIGSEETGHAVEWFRRFFAGRFTFFTHVTNDRFHSFQYEQAEKPKR